MNFGKYGLPEVSGLLLDTAGTKFSEQGITVESDGSRFQVTVAVVYPEWLSIVSGGYVVDEVVMGYRKRPDRPFWVRAVYPLSGAHVKKSSLQLGARPALSFQCVLDNRGSLEQGSTVFASIFKPRALLDSDSPEDYLSDARNAFSRAGGQLRQVLQVGSKLRRGRRSGIDDLHMLSGVAAARWAEEEGVSLLYLTQQQGESKPALKTQQAGYIGARDQPYAPVSAPFRNVAAYFNLQIIENALAGGQSLYTGAELEALAHFLNTDDFPNGPSIRPLIAWEARVASELFRAARPEVLAALMDTRPDGFLNLPIRRFIVNYLFHSGMSYRILQRTEGVEIAEEKLIAGDSGVRPWSCLLYVSKGEEKYQCIGYGPSKRDATNRAAFSVLMSMAFKRDVKAERAVERLERMMILMLWALSSVKRKLAAKGP